MCKKNRSVYSGSSDVRAKSKRQVWPYVLTAQHVPHLEQDVSISSRHLRILSRKSKHIYSAASIKIKSCETIVTVVNRAVLYAGTEESVPILFPTFIPSAWFPPHSECRRTFLVVRKQEEYGTLVAKKGSFGRIGKERRPGGDRNSTCISHVSVFKTWQWQEQCAWMRLYSSRKYTYGYSLL